MAVPREYYKAEIYEPMSFEELSWIAWEEVIKKFVVKNEDSSFSQNSDAFQTTFFSSIRYGCGRCEHISSFDSVILMGVREKYQYKLSKEEIIDMRKKMASSGRPESKRWWQIWL